MGRSKQGFTLIELLIVVAIIGILAAIAVPNFLNAQIRAKVAQAVNNMRAVQTALEAYQIDKGTYTRWAWDSNNPANDYMGFRDLTTPVSYVGSESFRNPFIANHQNTSVQGDGREVDPNFELATFLAKGDRNYDKGSWPRNVYLLESSGPDRGDDYNANNFPVEGRVYQPSNGLLSRGDFFRAGGAKVPSWAKTLTY